LSFKLIHRKLFHLTLAAFARLTYSPASGRPTVVTNRARHGPEATQAVVMPSVISDKR
jgi:hypothetical protein